MASFAKNLSRTVLPLSVAVAVALLGFACLTDPTEDHYQLAQADTPTADAGAPQCSMDGGADGGGTSLNSPLPNPFLTALGFGPSYLGFGGSLGFSPFGAAGLGFGPFGLGTLGDPLIGDGFGPFGGLPYGAGLGYLGFPGSWSTYLGWGTFGGLGVPPGGWPSGVGPGQMLDGGCK
jgi:hypothetical protein